jgi:hypothetical protein
MCFGSTAVLSYAVGCPLKKLHIVVLLSATGQKLSFNARIQMEKRFTPFPRLTLKVGEITRHFCVDFVVIHELLIIYSLPIR